MLHRQPHAHSLAHSLGAPGTAQSAGACSCVCRRARAAAARAPRSAGSSSGSGWTQTCASPAGGAGSEVRAAARQASRGTTAHSSKGTHLAACAGWGPFGRRAWLRGGVSASHSWRSTHLVDGVGRPALGLCQVQNLLPILQVGDDLESLGHLRGGRRGRVGAGRMRRKAWVGKGQRV